MAKFKVAAVFSNNMVLQRDKNIKIFGQGNNDDMVCVTFGDKTYKVKVKAERWSILLPPMSAGTGYQMTVACKEEVKCFENIAIGEVWLAGGQSNMEFELQNCLGGHEMLEKDRDPRVRFYYTNKIAHMDDHFFEMEEQSSWSEFSEENAKDWSAVGYIFGKRLAKELDVTVGIIGCNWGGTSASCWMSKEALSEDTELNTYLEEYYKGIEGKTEEEQIREYREYEAYHFIWEQHKDKLYEENPQIEWDEVLKICGDCKWPGPKNRMSPYRPGGLYETMLQRVMPYTLRGFLFYQGEEDANKPTLYEKLLTRMIRQWREGWEDINLPFLLVQLPMHRYKADPDTKSWSLIREAQMNIFQELKNTGIAVVLDCGEFNEIHPKDKVPVGERLGLQALYQVYGRIDDHEAFGPIFKSYEIKDSYIELDFFYGKDGFDIKGVISGFEIAGEDFNYVKAEARIKGSKIQVFSPEVKEPRHVRYCWTNYAEVTIYGKNGIPLAPFRTSNRQG